MEHIGETIRSLRLKDTGKALSDEPDEREQYTCPICQDAHFVHPLKEDGKPDYSTVVPCKCVREQMERERMQNLLRYCELPAGTAHMTFEKFKTSPQLQEAYDLAVQVANGVGEISWLTLTAGADRGKCVAADTLVLCADGRLKPISEICKWGAYQALTLKVAIEPQPVSNFYSDGVKPCVRVKTVLGREVVVTPDHPLLTPLGWQKAKELMIGESIAVVGYLPVFGKLEPEDYRVKLLAYLLGEGGLTQSYPIFTTTDPFARGEVDDSVNKFLCCFRELRSGKRDSKAPSYGIYGPSWHSTKGNTVKEWLIDLGLWGHPSRTKFIPDEVFEYSKPKLALFVSRLFSCDGWIQMPKKRRNSGSIDVQVGYSSASNRLIRQLSHLMLRFGIIGYVRRKQFAGNYYYEWAIKKKVEIKKFLDQIPVEGRLEPQAAKLVEVVKKTRYNFSPIIWTKVNAIEGVPAQPVYDLTIPITENFIANDIVVHNTHLAVAICRRWLQRGKPARYAFVPLLLEELRRGFREEGDRSYEARFDRFLNVPLLVMDDLGAEHRTPWVQEKLDTIIDYRLMNGLPLVVTTNTPVDELPFRIGSRLRRSPGSRVVFIDAPEFRKRKKSNGKVVTGGK